MKKVCGVVTVLSSVSPSSGSTGPSGGRMTPCSGEDKNNPLCFRRQNLGEADHDGSGYPFFYGVNEELQQMRITGWQRWTPGGLQCDEDSSDRAARYGKYIGSTRRPPTEPLMPWVIDIF